MDTIKELEVVAWRIGFQNGAGYEVYGTPQPWAHEQYGVPAVTLYEVQELCRISDANTMIDQIKAHNEAITRQLEIANGQIYGLCQERDTLRKQLDEANSALGSKNARIAEFAERHLSDFAELERLDKQLDESRGLLEDALIWVEVEIPIGEIFYEKARSWLEANK